MQLFPALPEVVRGMFRRPEALAVCPPGGDLRERGMFLNQTANYGLSQWENTDRILMEDFNSDNSKIDAALTGLDTRAAALEDELGEKGNCQLYFDMYTGNGTSGAANPTVLTFPREPLLALVAGAGTLLMVSPQISRCVFTSYDTNFQPSNMHITWSGSQVSFYSNGTASGVNNSAVQMNGNNQTYVVLALFKED